VNTLKQLYAFFKSIKLAVVLLIIIAALSALSTLVPQGEEAGFYANNYSPFLAALITGLHFHNFFRSTLFLLPVGLFFINLAVCTVDRIVNRHKQGALKRYGPDLIHVGILILMVAGIVSLVGKRQAYITLSKGEFAELPSGYQLFLNSFKRTTYEDGRPKDYVSSVEVTLEEEHVVSHEIRVNKPLKLGKYKVFQDSYSSTTTVVLIDEEDGRFTLKPGEGFRVGDQLYFLMGIEPGSTTGEAEQFRNARLLFEELDSDGVPVTTHMVGIRGAINRFAVDEIFITDQTILRVVQDSGFIPALVGFIIIGMGLVLTFVQKLGEKNI
jgi:cytochrome c biogenesis protein